MSPLGSSVLLDSGGSRGCRGLRPESWLLKAQAGSGGRREDKEAGRREDSQGGGRRKGSCARARDTKGSLWWQVSGRKNTRPLLNAEQPQPPAAQRWKEREKDRKAQCGTGIREAEERGHSQEEQVKRGFPGNDRLTWKMASTLFRTRWEILWGLWITWPTRMSAEAFNGIRCNTLSMNFRGMARVWVFLEIQKN